MSELLQLAFKLLETMFFGGIAGCVLVLTLTFIEDVKTLFL